MEIKKSVQDVKITDNLAFWMTNLPLKLRSIPIIHLAIPGSHDSTTYNITRKSPVAPDAEPIIKRLQFLGPLLRLIMSKWSRTQDVTVTQQLNHGVRYFDLRISTRKNIDKFFFVHGLYSCEVNDVLEEFQSFLETHPREVVILDFQHFYDFNQQNHETLMCLLSQIFRHKMLPYTDHMQHLSLEYLTTQFHYQVIVVYRSDAARFGQPLLWPSNCFPTPWPNTLSISKLITYLNHGLKKRDHSVSYISQCILTPTPWFVCKHVLSSLLSKCVLPLEKEKYMWLNKQKPGVGGLNIVISDFVDYENFLFAREVIGLNYKLDEQESIEVITPVD